MNDLQYQIMLIKSSIKFTKQLVWNLQEASAPHETVRGCLLQLKKYRHELKTKESMLSSAVID